MAAATQAIGERVGMPDLPYVQFPRTASGPPWPTRACRRVASLMVDMQLAMNRELAVRAYLARTAESTTPTTLEAFLKSPAVMSGFPGLRARFRGALLRPGEEGYDEARRIWNGAIDRRRPDRPLRRRRRRRRGRALRPPAGPAGVGPGRRACSRRPRRLRDGLMIDLSLLRRSASTPRPRRPGRRGTVVGRARRRHPAAGWPPPEGHQPLRIGGLTLAANRPPDAQARPDRRQPARRRPGHRRRRAAAGRRRQRARAALGAARRRRQLRHRHRPRVPAAPCGADRARRAGVLAAGGRGQGPAGSCGYFPERPTSWASPWP